MTILNKYPTNANLTSFDRTILLPLTKGFTIAEVPCFADTFMQVRSSVLRTKFSAKTTNAEAKAKEPIPIALFRSCEIFLQ